MVDADGITDTQTTTSTYSAITDDYLFFCEWVTIISYGTQQLVYSYSYTHTDYIDTTQLSLPYENVPTTKYVTLNGEMESKFA
jgi:hypothetical protein